MGNTMNITEAFEQDRKKCKAMQDGGDNTSVTCPGESNSQNTMYIVKQLSENFVDPFEWIPLELLSHCLSFLTIKDLCAASLVSKQFHKAYRDCLLWKALCARDLKLISKWDSITWRDYYQHISSIAWDKANCSQSDFKIAENQKALTKITPYGVATGRSKCIFSSAGKKYVFDIKVNYRRPNFFYGIGFIDKEINFNFTKAAYPKSENPGQTHDSFDKRFERQWFYWSDGNCWDILGSHPASAKSRTYISKQGVARTGTSDAPGVNSLAFYSDDIIGVVIDYEATSEQASLTYLLNGVVAHQFSIPKDLELYLAVYFYNANDSISIQHCAQNKYDKQLQELNTSLQGSPVN